MIIEPRHKSSYIINSRNNELEIIIPFKRNYYVIIMITVLWLTLQIITHNYIWLFCGLLLTISIVNILFGKEVIRINNEYLIQEFRISKFIIKTKTYHINQIKNIKISSGEYIDRIYKYALEIRFFGPEVGRVSFDYGKDCIKIIGDIDETEAAEIVQQMDKYISQKPVPGKSTVV